MRKRIFVLVLLFIVSIALAHPGRTDSSGGHYVRTPGYGYPVGSYHYHNGGPSGNTTATQDTSSVKRGTYSGFSREDYKLIQQDLKQSGFYSGSVDGIFGPKSLQSLKNYQAIVGKSHLSEQQMLEAILRAAKTNVKMQAESAVITPEIDSSWSLAASKVNTNIMLPERETQK